jgi:RNA polymerase sigma factor (sigma-70 family)
MTLDELVRAASRGDQRAWNELVSRFEGLVWATALAHRLSRADAADAVQTTWLRLVEHLDRIRDPERLGAWLATTARNECLRTIRLRSREIASDDADVFEAPSEEPSERRLVESERDEVLRRAFAKIGERCQALLRLLVSHEEPSYETVGAALGMPIGAIGPTRARCLEKLRSALALDPAFGGTA